MAAQTKNSRYIPKSVKEAVMERDRGICQICRRKAGDYPEFDHITPHSKGGPPTTENIQILCRKCNIEKRAKTAKCPKCGDWISHDATYCHHCGKSVPRGTQIYNKPSSGFDLRRTVGIVFVVGVVIYLIIDIYFPQLWK